VLLTLKTCAVRSWRTSDAESLLRHANNRNIWLNLRDAFPHPYTKHDARAYIRSVRDRSPETTFAIAVDDEAVGASSCCAPMSSGVGGDRLLAGGAVLGGIERGARRSPGTIDTASADAPRAPFA
jgi:hypothetical protein